MKAVRLHAFGAPDNLVLEDVPEPQAGPDEVVVRIVAAGVCHHDLLTRRGAFPRISLPVTLGHQITGTVEEVGPGVTELEVGQRVLCRGFQSCGECHQCRMGIGALCVHRPRLIGEDLDGGYAQYVVAKVRSWVGLPEEIDFVAGTVVVCAFGTAFHAVSTRGQVRMGESVLVTGASGGVGRHAVQILKAAGANVIAVTGSASKEQALLDNGADHVVTSREGEFAKDVKDITGEGADLVIEIVGGPSIAQSMHAVRPGGRIVVVGNLEGSTATIRPAHLILKEISLIGTKSSTEDELDRVLRMVADGVLEPQVAETIALEDAVTAHRRMEDRDASHGRMVMLPHG